MRYINNRNAEPKELTDYREGTPGASYNGFRDKDVIKQSLIEEQGYLCAYCMGKIKDINDCSIEHYISQKKHDASPHSPEYHRKQSLLYSNMLGVCLNNAEHCDKKRGNIPLQILDPHQPSCESLITYSLGGSIISVGDRDEIVEQDLNTLGLNCNKLIECRNAALEEVWNRFAQEHEKKSWSKELFLERAQFYRTKQSKRGKTKFHAYCNYIAWYFEYYAENYNNKG